MWTLAKLRAALSDLPEVAALVVLVGGTLAHGVYVMKRSYLGLAGESFISPTMRHDMERQISYGQEHITPALTWRVAHWRMQHDGGLDVGVWPFHNRAHAFEHQIPTHAHAHAGVPAEGPAPTEY